MNGAWKYHIKSKEHLDKFLNTIKEKEIDKSLDNDGNLLYQLFRKNFEQTSNEELIKEDNIIDLSSQDSEINNINDDLIQDIEMIDCEESDERIEEISCINKINEIAEQLLEDIQDDNLDNERLDEIISSEHFSLICTKLIEKCTPDAAFKLCTNFCDLSPSYECVKSFCVSFITPLLQEDKTSRSIDNCVHLFMCKYPLEMCQFVICSLMINQKPISMFVNSNLITDLDVKYKALLLKQFLNNFNEVHEWILSIVLSLFKSIPEENVDDYKSIIKYLRVGSNVFSKNVNFGKLLHAVVQKFCCNKELRQDLEFIANENQSAFKSSILNLLKK